MNQSSNDKIIIAGDSWGCGEWDYNGTLLHQGIEQYFKDDGFTVINCSVGGYSNENSINELRKTLIEHPNPDYIFWVQTDPIRDIRPFWRLPENEIPYKTLTHELIKHRGFDKLCSSLLSKHYTDLNNLGVKVHLIGGKRDIDVALLAGLNNLEPTVISWVKLLVGHIKEYDKRFPFKSGSDFTTDHIDLNSMDTDLRYLVVDELHYMNMCWSIFETESIFHPDKGHPNRHGHYKLFEFLKKELSL